MSRFEKHLCIDQGDPLGLCEVSFLCCVSFGLVKKGCGSYVDQLVKTMV